MDMIGWYWYDNESSMIPISWSLYSYMGYVAPLEVEWIEHGFLMFSKLGIEHLHNIL